MTLGDFAVDRVDNALGGGAHYGSRMVRHEALL